MTPAMVRALSAAESCYHRRGLQRMGAHWCTDDGGAHPEYCAHSTVRALIRRGYLDVWSGGTCAHITDAGRAALARWREQQR